MRALALFLPSLLAALLLVSAPAAASPLPAGAPTQEPAASLTADEPGQPSVSLTAETTAVGTVQLVVTVLGPDAAPLAGTADLAEGEQSLVSGLELRDGAVLHELTGVTPGDHTYTATYRSADGTTSGSASASVVVAGRAVSALALTGSSPAVGAVRVVVALTVAGEPATGGSVELREGDRVLAPALSLVNGTATYETVGVAPGTHTYTVSYAGSDTTAAAREQVSVEIRDRGSAVLAVQSSSSAVGKLTLRVGVTAAGAAVSGGTVTIKEGATVRATGLQVRDGVAVWNATGLAAGRHTYAVSFSGTPTVAGASTLTTSTVKAQLKPALTVQATSTAVGKLTLRVGVTAAGAPVTGGTVTIKEGSKTRASKLKVSRGSAIWSASGLTSGRHTYTVSYDGSSEVTRGSTTVTVTVKAKVKPTVKLSASSPVPNKVVVTVTVTAAGQSGLGGTVTVKEGSRTLKTGLKVSGGRATWSSGTAKAGKHTYSVSYGGTSQVTSGTAKVSVSVRAVKTYANCTALNKDYRHGVGRSGARDRVSGQTEPVTDFAVHTALYKANTKSDRDKDGVACEKQ